MKAISCAACRKKIAKEAEEAYLKKEYAFFNDAAYSMAVYATCAALAVHHRRGRSKRYIRKLYDEMVLIMTVPAVFGKQITMSSVMKQLEEEYGIDFTRIKPNIESEKEFVRGAQKGAR